MKNLLKAGFLSILASTSVQAGGDPYYDDAVIPEQITEERDYAPSSGSRVEVDFVEADYVDLRKKAELEEKENEDMDAELRALEETKRQLEEAIAINEKAASDRDEMIRTQELASQEALKMANARAEMLEQESRVNLAKQTIIPALVMGEQISVTATGEKIGTLKEITKRIMPAGWTVNESYKEGSKLYKQHFEFITTDRRDSALRELYAGVDTDKVFFQYFWDLVDQDGYPAPVILITDHR